MILRRLRADFGALSGETLELTPGLNVIEAPNESGKSTWCAFVRVMLYGPSGRSGKGVPRSDKELYTPWDGRPMRGTVELNWQGKDVTLRRSSDGAAGPMRTFSAVYTGTGREVSALTDTDAGERLTGLTAEVFRRTAFIGPAGLKVAAGPELEKYIAASAASGEEGVSYSETAARLRGWQRRYSYRGQGKLPSQEAEIRRLEEKLRACSQIADELRDTEQREQRASAAYSDLTDRAGTAARERSRVRQKILDREEERRRRERQAASIRAELEASPFGGEVPDEAFLHRARVDARRCAGLLRDGDRFPASRSWALCLLLAAFCGAAGLFRAVFLLPCAALLAAGAALYYRRSRQIAVSREMEALQKRYGAASPKGILAAAKEYAALYREMRSLDAAAEELRAGPEESLPDAEPSLTGALAAAGEELRALSAQKARLLARREALGDRGELAARLDALRAEHERDTRTAAALETALTELAAADEEMQARFAPALSRRTERYFRALTGGRYDSLTLDRELSAGVQRTGDDRVRADCYLSRGARDQLCLALRLALCESAGNECPLILDDALVTFDDERLGYALEVLRSIARTRQVLLFTCQHREQAYLEGKGETEL